MELAYRTTVAAARAALTALDLRIDLEGEERVPAAGPVVLVANHVSFLDFLLVGLVGRRRGRYVRFLARHDLWHHSLVGRVMTAMRHVPVDRAAPAAAYLRARALLREGETVGVFPEAGISTSWTVRGLMPGAAALAAESGAPLVPVALWGPQRVATAHRPVDLTRGRPVSVRVGTPVHVPAGSDPRRVTRYLGTVLQEMLDELQSRPEHQPRVGEPVPWHPAHLGGGAPPPSDAAHRLPRSAVAPVWTPGVRSGASGAGG